MTIQPLPPVPKHPGVRRIAVYVETDNYGARSWSRVWVPGPDVARYCAAVERAAERQEADVLEFDTILTGSWRTTAPRISVTPSAPPRRRRRGSTPRAGPRAKAREKKQE